MSSDSTLSLPGLSRLKRAALGFVAGATANAFLFFMGVGFTGAGHGIATFANLTAGPGGVTLFLLPFACAGTASRWPPAMCSALALEVIHHLWSLATNNGLAKLGAAEKFSDGHSMTGSFYLWLVVYVLTHGYVWVGFLMPWQGAQKRGGGQ